LSCLCLIEMEILVKESVHHEGIQPEDTMTKEGFGACKNTSWHTSKGAETVLFISGHARDVILDEWVHRDATVEYLQKPFFPKELLQKIRRILGKRD
jgi:hypothetical protein